MGHLRLHVYSYTVMVPFILANPCMGPRGTYRNVSVTNGLSGHFRSFLWRHPSRPLGQRLHPYRSTWTSALPGCSCL